MTGLPDLPSALIRLALADLAKVEAQPDKYVVDMSAWYVPDAGRQKQCAVCFAGSVMAGTLGCREEIEESPNFYDNDTAEKLWALNDFRLGSISRGLGWLGCEGVWQIPARIPITPYDAADPASFRADMEAMAAMLEGHGL